MRIRVLRDHGVDHQQLSISLPTRSLAAVAENLGFGLSGVLLCIFCSGWAICRNHGPTKVGSCISIRLDIFVWSRLLAPCSLGTARPEVAVVASNLPVE